MTEKCLCAEFPLFTKTAPRLFGTPAEVITQPTPPYATERVVYEAYRHLIAAERKLRDTLCDCGRIKPDMCSLCADGMREMSDRGRWA